MGNRPPDDSHTANAVLIAHLLRSHADYEEFSRDWEWRAAYIDLILEMAALVTAFEDRFAEPWNSDEQPLDWESLTSAFVNQFVQAELSFNPDTPPLQACFDEAVASLALQEAPM